jgi:hypothetical protein
MGAIKMGCVATPQTRRLWGQQRAPDKPGKTAVCLIEELSMEATMGDVLLRGGCPCDAVRFEISDVFDAGYCHCNRCRKQSGAPVFAFVHVPRNAFTLLCGELVAEPWERLGQGMICASCRGGVCFDMGDRDLLSIAIGRLDEPARVRPTFHQCVSSKLPWFEINDDLPRFRENTITHPRERQSPIVAET